MVSRIKLTKPQAMAYDKIREYLEFVNYNDCIFVADNDAFYGDSIRGLVIDAVGIKLKFFNYVKGRTETTYIDKSYLPGLYQKGMRLDEDFANYVNSVNNPNENGRDKN